MRKRLALVAFGAGLAALLAIGVWTPAQATDRTYSLCDARKSRMCSSLAALFEFEEEGVTGDVGLLTSETGSLPFIEPPSADTSPGATSINGYSLQLAASGYVYIPRTASLGGEFTLNLWVKWATDPANGDALVYTYDSAPAIVGSYIWFTNSSGDVRARFHTTEEVTDTSGEAVWGSDISANTWHLISVGEYPTPTSSNPYQWTIWIAVDAGTKVTANMTWPPKVFVGDLRLAGGTNGYAVDQLSIFSRPLSAGELTWLYNSRSGRAYPFTANP